MHGSRSRCCPTFVADADAAGGSNGLAAAIQQQPFLSFTALEAWLRAGGRCAMAACLEEEARLAADSTAADEEGTGLAVQSADQAGTGDGCADNNTYPVVVGDDHLTEMCSSTRSVLVLLALSKEQTAQSVAVAVAADEQLATAYVSLLTTCLKTVAARGAAAGRIALVVAGRSGSTMVQAVADASHLGSMYSAAAVVPVLRTAVERLVQQQQQALPADSSCEMRRQAGGAANRPAHAPPADLAGGLMVLLGRCLLIVGQQLAAGVATPSHAVVAQPPAAAEAAAKAGTTATAEAQARTTAEKGEEETEAAGPAAAATNAGGSSTSALQAEVKRELRLCLHNIGSACSLLGS